MTGVSGGTTLSAGLRHTYVLAASSTVKFLGWRRYATPQDVIEASEIHSVGFE